jgi:uncharacterized membrane protein (UPF0136 family)
MTKIPVVTDHKHPPNRAAYRLLILLIIATAGGTVTTYFSQESTGNKLAGASRLACYGGGQRAVDQLDGWNVIIAADKARASTASPAQRMIASREVVGLVANGIRVARDRVDVRFAKDMPSEFQAAVLKARFTCAAAFP